MVLRVDGVEAVVVADVEAAVAAEGVEGAVVVVGAVDGVSRHYDEGIESRHRESKGQRMGVRKQIRSYGLGLQLVKDSIRFNYSRLMIAY